MSSLGGVMSSNDNAVLGALFDPEGSLAGTVEFDTGSSNSLQEETFRSTQKEERKLLSRMNHESVNPEEIQAAISSLTTITLKNPQYASAWNNRAQAKRLLIEPQDLPCRPGELQSIMDDLGEAIALASPKSPGDPVSEMNSKVLASAHTHRGYLFWLASRSSSMGDVISRDLEGGKSWDQEALEELASRDFAIGGRYGNDAAKQLAIKTNPYAKLCGNIVKEAMQKEIREYHKLRGLET